MKIEKILPLILLGFVITSGSLCAQTLKHSYTFGDGLATDIISGADGTLIGGEIKNSAYVASRQGNYIELPAGQIQINSYSAITLEALVLTPTDNENYTMLSYFGRTVGSNGVDYVFQSVKSGGSSKTSISCLNSTDPWSTETAVRGDLLDDGDIHHVVTTIDATSINLYIDGALVDVSLLSNDNKIGNLSNELAYLCKGGYTADPTWLGTIYEFNIYEGSMNGADINERSHDYFTDLSFLTTGNGKIDFKDLLIQEIEPISVAEFYSGLSFPKLASVEILDATGSPIESTSTTEMKTGMKLSVTIEGNTTEFTLVVRSKSQDNFVTYAFGGLIDHELSLIANLYNDLSLGQFMSGIKVSDFATFKVVDDSGNEIIDLETIIDRFHNVEVTSETGDVKTYEILVGTSSMPTITVADSVNSFFQIRALKYNLEDGVEWHIKSSDDPLPGSHLSITGEDVWVYFDNITPQEVFDNYWNQIKVNGSVPVIDETVRLVQHGNGSVLIGHPSSFKPLTVFTDPNLSGESKELGLYTYYKKADNYTSEPNVPLATFEDNIESFVLKKGYMASFSQNSNGTGASEVFIADKEDIVVNTMPSGLANSVSFIRVFPWRWVNKKGYVGIASDGENANSQWVYCHCDSYDKESSLNVEYVPLRHNPGWPSYGPIQAKKNVTHALFFNEPDNAVDDGFSSVEDAIAQYPNLLASGLRMVSPAPTDGGASWLFDFVEQCKVKNYRLDAVAIHFYRGCQSPQQFYNFLNYIHTNTGLPVWVTEWNNGCNWSGEACIPDSYEEQAQVIKEWVDMLESAPFVERYSIWPGCTTYQQFWGPDGLTPAGKIYYNKSSTLAYNSFTTHNLNPYPGNQSTEVRPDVVLSWTPDPLNNGQQLYFGESYPPTYQAQVDPKSGSIDLGQLDFNTTYYWRLDKVIDGTIIQGEDLEFTTQSIDKPSNPSPSDLSTGVNPDVTFSWTFDSDYEYSHSIYLGTNEEELELETELSGEIKSYSRTLNPTQTYYWRVDEHLMAHDGTELINSSDVWSFITVEPLSAGVGQSLKFYPNPVKNELIIEGIEDGKTVDIYNMTGQKKKSVFSKGRLDFSDLTDGVYILKIEGYESVKIIK